MFISSKIISYLRRIRGKVDRQYRKDVLTLLEKNPSAKLLDCGCGDGEFTLKVAEKIGTREIYGIDFVADNCRSAEEKGIKVYQSDLNKNLSFGSEDFDVVFANQIIEHLWNTDNFLKEVHRVLKREGYLILSTPNLAGFHNMLALLLGRQPIDADISDEILGLGTCNAAKGERPSTVGPGHRRLFTIRALKELLEHYDFEVEKIIGSGYLPFPFPLARALSFIDKKHSVIITIKARKS